MMYKEKRLARMSMRQKKRLDSFTRMPISAMAILLLTLFTACYADASGSSVAVISAKCGNTEMSIRCTSMGNGSVNCLHPSLVLRADKGKMVRINKPVGLENHSPVGLGCKQSPRDHLNYFTVKYSDLPIGCAVCEWYHLYDANGKILTHNNPPTITIPNAPPSQSIGPNNDEYEKISSELKVADTKTEDIICEGPHINRNGNLICMMEVGNGE